MKLRSIALAAAALACSSAFAVPAVNVDASNTVRVYLSGASALRAAVAGVVLNDICGGSAANSTTTLYNLAESGSGFTFTGNFWAITCRVTAAGGALVGLPANTSVAFFKSDAGGSAQGVFPVYFGTARPFVEPANLAACTLKSADRVYDSCPATRSAVPNFGVSDVEPNLFSGANVPTDPLDADDDGYPVSGLSSAQQADLTIKPIVQTVFGIAVNTSLYNDMFVKQGLSARKDFAGAACTVSSTDEPCIPSIGYAEARSVFAGTEANWRLLSANTAKLDTQLNVCRRVAGSGTQAAANAHLLGTPCNSGGIQAANWEFSSSASPENMSSSQNKTASTNRSVATYLVDNMGGNAGNGPMPSGTTFIFEGPGTGDVVSCMNAAQKAGGYAIGHISKENAPGANNWKHVRLEGTFPLRDNAKAGRYDYVFESTVQWNTGLFNSLSAQQRSFISGFAATIAKPDALAKLPAANQNGVAALPDAYAGDFGVGSANEVAFGSRVTRSGNSCQPMTAIK